MSDHGAPIEETRTNTVDIYDHAISLIDTTAPPPQAVDVSRSASQSPSRKDLVKKTTRTSMRDTLARRRYAKWQQDRYTSDANGNHAEEEGTESRPAASTTGSAPAASQGGAGDNTQTDTADFADNTDSDRGRTRSASKDKKPKREHARKKDTTPYEVDILYENQRGMFFFGIPLYSHSSLLNFDPSPWVTKDLKDSAVDITNAQVPDPSWEWAWKSWYVDMSYDVDEEGWQYSFSFNRQFVWHGTHPWFHSYVRRRRWLRKRVKRHGTASHDKAGSMSAGHMLTGDYFTIHPKREKSPVSTLDGDVRTAQASHLSKNTMAEEEKPPEEIKDIPSLLKALKLASVDREKIEAVQKFVREGGEELVYLEEHIPEIMSFLVFQNSRRQLLEYLRQTASDAQKHRDEHVAEDKPENAAETRRIDNLLHAVRAADGEITGLEYWSDRQHVLKTTDDEAKGTLAASNGATFVDGSHDGMPLENNPVDSIRGISDDADVGVDHSKRTFSPPPEKQNGTEAIEGKGKGKGKTKADKESPIKDDGASSHPDPPAQLPADSILVN